MPGFAQVIAAVDDAWQNRREQAIAQAGQLTTHLQQVGGEEASSDGLRPELLGAAAAQVGTAYLFTPESLVSDLHRDALKSARDDTTALTNVFSGRPARGLVNRVMREVGPMSDAAPAFPIAGGALAPLKARAEAAGSADFSSLWSGQAARLARETGAADLTRRLAADAARRLKALMPSD